MSRDSCGDGGQASRGDTGRFLAKAMLDSIDDVSRAAHVRITSSLNPLRRLWRDASGAAGIEYGLIVVGISIAILSTIFAIGTEMNNYSEGVDSRVSGRLGS